VQPRSGVSGLSRKQELLKRHRRNKRVALLVALIILIAAGCAGCLVAAAGAGCPGLGRSRSLVFGSSVLFARRRLPIPTPCAERSAGVTLRGDLLHLDQMALDDSETLVLAITIKSSWLGRFLDPWSNWTGGEGLSDSQAFERGVNGLRYLNLTGLGGC
jgi:hypothetical protein